MGLLAHAFYNVCDEKATGADFFQFPPFFFFFGHLSSTLGIESSLVYRTQLDDYPFGCSKPISSHLRESMYLVDEANLSTHPM
jgi:hypothetical protein